MHFERRIRLSKCTKIIFFLEKKYVCLPILMFSDPLPKNTFFIRPNPSVYTMDCPDLTVPNFMENPIGLKMVDS